MEQWPRARSKHDKWNGEITQSHVTAMVSIISRVSRGWLVSGHSPLATSFGPGPPSTLSIATDNTNLPRLVVLLAPAPRKSPLFTLRILCSEGAALTWLSTRRQAGHHHYAAGNRDIMLYLWQPVPGYGGYTNTATIKYAKIEFE